MAVEEVVAPDAGTEGEIVMWRTIAHINHPMEPHAIPQDNLVSTTAI